jgi:hypothetical protein
VKCKICRQASYEIFEAQVLQKYQIKYFCCSQCGFIQTEEPYWLTEAYENPLNTEDTGILKRNEYFRSRVSMILLSLFSPSAKFLDYGGGYGVFTRMMRDVGFNYFWQDKYAQNILARGFTCKEGERFEAITAFEVFEHLTDVHEEVEEMLKFSDTIIFSTLLHGQEVPSKDWWYYAFNHGQHISLFTAKSLELLAASKGLNFYTNGANLHMFTKKPYSNGKFKFRILLAKWFWFYFKTKGLKSKTDADFEMLSKV